LADPIIINLACPDPAIGINASDTLNAPYGPGLIFNGIAGDPVTFDVYYSNATAVRTIIPQPITPEMLSTIKNRAIARHKHKKAAA